LVAQRSADKSVGDNCEMHPPNDIQWIKNLGSDINTESKLPGQTAKVSEIKKGKSINEGR